MVSGSLKIVPFDRHSMKVQKDASSPSTSYTAIRTGVRGCCHAIVTRSISCLMVERDDAARRPTAGKHSARRACVPISFRLKPGDYQRLRPQSGAQDGWCAAKGCDEHRRL